MAVWGAVVGAVIGAAAGGISAYMNSSKQAKAYKKAAQSIRDAIEEYSGDAAYNKIKQGGYDEARLVNSNALGQLSRVNQDNPLTVQNFQNSANNIADYDMTAANSAGRERASSKLNALYNKDTAHAQNLLNQGLTEANAQSQMIQAGFNAAGNLAQTYGTAFSGSGKKSDPGSDERIKEPINNESGLPKSDVEDSLRQIETVAYQYKDPSQPGADAETHESGVTAQSLEKTPLFKDVVVEDGGIKKIDQWKLQEALTAGIANLQRELDELEGNNANNR